MEQYKVAIITRTKDREVFLKRAVKSVSSQTFKDWIMVIVNDGGDRSIVDKVVEEYGREYQSRIKVIHNDTSLGPQNAANIGVKASESKYVVFHDDDDTWEPDFLMKCVGFLDNNTYPSIKGVITHSAKVMEKVEDGSIIIENKEPFNSFVRNVSLFRLAASSMITSISFVFERAVFDEVGYFDESLPVLEDWEFYLRFVGKYDVFVIPELLANFHKRIRGSEADSRDCITSDTANLMFYDNLIRNRLIRRDLEKGSLGMGVIVNLARTYDFLLEKLDKLESTLKEKASTKQGTL